MKTKNILVSEEQRMIVRPDFIKKMVDVHFVAWVIIVLVSKLPQSYAPGDNIRVWELVLVLDVINWPLKERFLRSFSKKNHKNVSESVIAKTILKNLASL